MCRELYYTYVVNCFQIFVSLTSKTTRISINAGTYAL